jgi:hypothetical protein
MQFLHTEGSQETNFVINLAPVFEKPHDLRGVSRPLMRHEAL